MVVTPAEYEYNSKADKYCKVMPAQGETRRQREKDRKTSIYLAKIKAAKQLAGKLAFIKKQRSNRTISKLRGQR